MLKFTEILAVEKYLIFANMENSWFDRLYYFDKLDFECQVFPCNMNTGL